jgi:hypothetical protein
VSEHVTAAMLSMQPSVQSGCTQVFSGARGLGNAALLAVLHGLACSAHPLMRPAQDRPAGAGETRGVGWALLSALGTLLLNHLQLRLCRVHLRFHVRRLQQLLLPSQVLSPALSVCMLVLLLPCLGGSKRRGPPYCASRIPARRIACTCERVTAASI